MATRSDRVALLHYAAVVAGPNSPQPMNPGLDLLQPYPFERLATLLQGASPSSAKATIDLTIGEPAHATPSFIIDALVAALDTTSRYPATKGLLELRSAIAGWLSRRYQLPETALDPERHILPLNGTREGLFAIAQFWLNSAAHDSIVVMPNPGYQVYEGATLLAGGTPYYLNLDSGNGYLPDLAGVPEQVWRRCRLLYLCSPSNPTGRIMPVAMLDHALQLAQQHSFLVVADECYAELYDDEVAPPPGILEVAHCSGISDFRNCVTLHSLSKRSNVPGLRSGFIAGDPTIMGNLYRYRTYHGCAMPLFTQHASIAAWNDDAHVRANRLRYREKFDALEPILGPTLGVRRPEGGFYYWARVPGDEEAFVRQLYEQERVKLVPGRYLARDFAGGNPGISHVRIALVQELSECIEAAHRIAAFVQR